MVSLTPKEVHKDKKYLQQQYELELEEKEKEKESQKKEESAKEIRRK